MIKPICYKCKDELDDFGAIILSPPFFGNRDCVQKVHICVKCYHIFLDFINQYGLHTKKDGRDT